MRPAPTTSSPSNAASVRSSSPVAHAGGYSAGSGSAKAANSARAKRSNSSPATGRREKLMPRLYRSATTRDAELRVPGGGIGVVRRRGTRRREGPARRVGPCRAQAPGIGQADEAEHEREHEETDSACDHAEQRDGDQRADHPHQLETRLEARKSAARHLGGRA